MCKGVLSKVWSLELNEVVTHGKELEGNDVVIVLGKYCQSNTRLHLVSCLQHYRSKVANWGISHVRRKEVTADFEPQIYKNVRQALKC